MTSSSESVIASASRFEPAAESPLSSLPVVRSHRRPGGLNAAFWSITYPTLLRSLHPTAGHDPAPGNVSGEVLQ